MTRGAAARRRSRWVLSLVVVAGVLAAGALVASHAGSGDGKSGAGRSAGMRVLLVGDSLAFQALPDFRFIMGLHRGVELSTAVFGGTALCDWVPEMARLLSEDRPTAVVLEFYGDSFTPCTVDPATGRHATGEALVSLYAAAARRVAVDIRAEGAVAYWVVAPVSSSGDPEPRLIASAEYRAAEPVVASSLVDAGAAVLDHGRFTETLPCLSWEPCPPVGARRGVAVVRSPDGIHFCPVAQPVEHGVVGACPVWSSGAWRFAQAMAAPVLAGDGAQPASPRRDPVTAGHRRHPGGLGSPSPSGYIRPSATGPHRLVA